ncbi:MAG: DUF4397 domain-containing protein [Chitinophaga sp.]|uniref:hypothetical protein n=1 Tax=Chitinophaga sp. TaxID=1869181 RepID=UPI0025BCFD90|nr:hypothetical protein [Chitinophaga sp.]MBV8255618.1 DUF4397 domain-containing protein [Chitinophaga sp.]
MKRYIALLSMICLVAACNKDVTAPELPEVGKISYVFSSSAIINAVAGSSSGAMVLVDSRDTTYTANPTIEYSQYPYLYRVDNASIPVYPRLNSIWTKFTNLNKGKHQLLLADTSGFGKRRILDSMQVDINPDAPTIVYYGDSCGNFSHIVAADKYLVDTAKVGVRIINLSPFTGPVYMTLNKQVPVSFPASTKYKDNTGFLSLPVSGPTTFNIKLYSVSNTSSYIATGSMSVTPGHAYTLVIYGYSNNNPGSYIDPTTGRTVSITPNLTILTTNNY